MIKKYKHLFIMMIFISMEIFICAGTIIICISLLNTPAKTSAASPINKKIVIYSNEKRGNPAYDKITGGDGWPHYRVFFWVPKTASKYTPYADEGINTNVSSHGPAEKWTVVETNTVNADEKLVFIFVPKTFVYLYGKGFEKVIHLRYK